MYVVMDELDEIVARLRKRGPAPLTLNGFNQGQSTGWNETTTILHAHLPFRPGPTMKG